MVSQSFALEFTSKETKRKQKISGVPKFQKAQVNLFGDNSYWATEMRGGNVPLLADFWLNMRCSFCPRKWAGCWKSQVKVGSRILTALEPQKCYCSDSPYPPASSALTPPQPASSFLPQAELPQVGLWVSFLPQCVYNTVLPIPQYRISIKVSFS